MASEPMLVAVPKENVNDESVRLAAWRAADRSAVEAGAVLAELETSKAVVEVTAPIAGFVRHAAAEGASILVGGALCFITAGPDDPLPFTGGAGAQAAAAPGSASAAGGPTFSKAALDLIAREGLDKAVFAGRGLVTAREVSAHLHKARGAASGSHVKGLGVVREELPRRKLVEIQSLSRGQNAGLASSVAVACPAEGFRKALEADPSLKATPGALVVFEAARLLRRWPLLNAYYDDGCAGRYDAVNIGFVVDADKGLKVPVVRDADKKSVQDVARSMQDLMLSYEEDGLTPEDTSGGTFTVTDLSAEGVVSFHPLINDRQSAILGVAAARPETRTFELVLTFDHRLTEGRSCARFLKALAERLSSARAAG